MNILLIDDDAFVNRALGFALRQLGHEVTIAHDGDEALGILERQKNFELIFCDILMPVLSGPSFLILLRRYYPIQLPAVAVISGVNNVVALLTKLDVKYDYFIKKPFDMAKIKMVLNSVELKQSTKPI